MISFQKFNAFSADIGDKVHNFAVDVLKVMLSNTPPVAANAIKADIVEIAPGNGYSAGGAVIPATAFSQVAGLATLTGGNAVITAAGGPIGPAQFVVIYNASALAGNLIGWFDYGAPFTLADTKILTVSFPTGILTLYLQ